MQASPELNPGVISEADATHGHGHDHPDFRIIGFLVFLFSESMLFLGMFAAYLIFRASTAVWPPEETEIEVLIPAINTVILVSSSFVIHQADIAIKKRGDVAGLQKWFFATFLMGVVFLGGQIYEYANLGFGITTNQFSSAFYLLTGFHGLHVFVGLLLILGVLWRSRQPGHYSETAHHGVEAASIYWHFVDVIWILLFLIVYIL